MSVSKNHHYVPAFYLNRWDNGLGSGKKYKKVWCWGYTNNSKLLCSSKSTKSICSKEFLYTRNTDSVTDKQIIEDNFLKNHDSKSSEVYSRILSGEILTLKNNERSVFTAFLCGLFFRHPARVKLFKQLATSQTDEIFKELQPEFIKNRKKEWPENVEGFLDVELPDFKPNMGIDAVPRLIQGKNEDSMHQWIHAMHWSTIDVSRATKTLLTSDNPIYFSSNILSDDCMVYLPISPNKIFLASSLLNAIEASIDIASKKPNILIKMLNQSLLKQSDELIISNTKSSTDYISRYWKQPRDPRQLP